MTELSANDKSLGTIVPKPADGGSGAKAPKPGPAPTGPGASKVASKTKKKSGSKKAPPKKKPHNPLSSGVFVGNLDPKLVQKSSLFSEGFAVHPVRGTYGKNPHEEAASLRGMRHQNAYNAAFDLLKKKPEAECVVACYPTAREEKLSVADERVVPFREQLYPGDSVRGLRTHNPDIPQRRCVVAVLLDCPQVNLQDLFRRLCTKDGELFVVYGGVNLSGKLGYDALNWSSEPATLWRRDENGLVGSLALGCVTQYADKPSRAWLDCESGQLTKNICFEHKPLAKRGVAGFISVIRVLIGKRERKPLPFPLSNLGVLIDDDGFVPALSTTNWTTLVTSSPHCVYGVEKAIEDHIRQINKRLSRHLMGFPEIYREFYDACVRTVNRLARTKRPQIELLPESRKKLAAAEAAKERFSEMPFGSLFAVLSQRDKPFELIRKLYQVVKDMFRDFLARFKEWRDERYPEVAKVAEIIESDEEPLNVFFSLSKALSKLAEKAANSEVKAFRRTQNTLGWLANKLRRPFVLLDEDDDELSYFAKCFLAIGSVVLERFFATCAGSLSAFIVAAIEVFLVALQDDTVLGGIAHAAVKALGHLILALLPFWLSLPLHLLIDLYTTGHIEVLVQKLSETKLGGFLLKVVSKIRSGITNLRRMWFGVSENGDLMDDQYGSVQHSVSEKDWLLTPVPKQFTHNGKLISQSQVDVLRKLTPKTREAIPLLFVEELQNVALTHASFAGVLLCLEKRYTKVLPAPDGCGDEIKRALTFFHKHTVDTKVKPWTVDKFLKHCKDHGYPSAKVEEYRKCFLLYEKNEFDGAAHTAPFQVKPHEVLALRSDGAPKTRGVHTFPPASHVPHILFAKGLKDAMAEKFSWFKYTNPSQEWTWYFCRVQKGSSEEIAFRLSLMRTGDIVVFTAGDDNYLAIRTRKNIWTIAVDFSSCDSTMQSGALGAIHWSHQHMGVPTEVTAANMQKCTGKRTILLRFKDEFREFEFLPDFAYNASGTDLTTANTDMYSAALWSATMATWDGDVNKLLPAVRVNADIMGIKLSIESYPDTTTSGLTEIGVATFLSMVPMRSKKAACGFTAVPASHTKKLLVKGPSQSDKGLTVDFGVACRLGGSLLSTPYGKRINNALKRHYTLHPFANVKPPKDPSEEYKLQWDSSAIDEEEEFKFLSRRIPGLDYLAYLAELDEWDSISEFPVEPPKDSFPIFRELASQHYGYLKSREIRDNG